jgi:hypothetical protein
VAEKLRPSIPILVPDDKLEDAKLGGEREVGREIEGGIFGVVNGIDCPLHDRCLLAQVEYRNDDETEQQVHAADNLYLEDDDGRFLPLPLPARIAGTLGKRAADLRTRRIFPFIAGCDMGPKKCI